MNQTQCLFAVGLTFQRNFLQRQNDNFSEILRTGLVFLTFCTGCASI